MTTRLASLEKQQITPQTITTGSTAETITDPQHTHTLQGPLKNNTPRTHTQLRDRYSALDPRTGHSENTVPTFPIR